MLEASAGTGKTYTVGALVARYVAEGVATLDQMLVITFGRAASQELRERVRDQLVAAERALADPSSVDPSDELLTHLVGADVPERRRRIGDALAGFDGATIATTHQFCQLVLRSLGVAGDTDSRAELVESLDDLVVEVTDDLYLQRFGALTDPPPFDRAVALRLARAAVDDPQATLSPLDAEPGTDAALRVDFASAVRREVERRKHLRGVLSYDDLLSRLASALEADDAPARQRMRQRWEVVLVDEFQDTDPVQWDVLDRAFTGQATLVLIGDPKQAIYAFRGGDVVTYLRAAGTASTRHTLATNWRSDAGLVSGLQTLTRGAELGDPEITVLDVEAHHRESRLVGSPTDAPLRVRLLRASDFPTGRDGTVRIDLLREHIAQRPRRRRGPAARLRRDVRRGADRRRPRRPAAVQRQAGRADPGRPAGARHPLGGRRWQQRDAEPRGRRVADPARGARAAAHQPGARGGADLVRRRDPAVPRRRRRRPRRPAWPSASAAGSTCSAPAAWRRSTRRRPRPGSPGRVLARPDGERLMTDLDHLGQLLHETARRQRLGLPALLEWFRAERREAFASTERTRRLDTDAAAVQILTIHGSKGLQYPVVYLPHFFDCYVPEPSELLYHDESGARRLDLAGSPDAVRRARTEDAGEELRLTYVALTRAQSQVVTWWGPSKNAAHSGLSRLLFGRSAGRGGGARAGAGARPTSRPWPR